MSKIYDSDLTRRRLPNRKHLFYPVLPLLEDGRWFSARQLCELMYAGRGTPHPIQVKRVADQLDLLCLCLPAYESRDDLAACRLYRHRNGPGPAHGFAKSIGVRVFKPAWLRRNRPLADLIVEAVDYIAPPNVDVNRFSRSWRLEPARDLLALEPAVPMKDWKNIITFAA